MSRRFSFGVDPGFVDYVEECEARAARWAEQHNLGNFPPYYVRRPNPWGCIFPGHRWAIWEDWSEMHSINPGWMALGPYWSFATACAIAVRLQEARLKLTPPENLRAAKEAIPLSVD